MSLTERVDAALRAALNEKRIVGAVIITLLDGEVAHRKAYGFLDREAKTAMKPAALFRLASLTKPIVTAAAMRMIEQGQIALEAAVTDWLPDFRPKLADGSAPAITIRQLLTHTSGLAYDFMQPPDGPYTKLAVSSGGDQPGLSMAEELRRLTAAGLMFAPGAMWLYSNSIDVLGAVMEKAARTSLPEIVARLVGQPMGWKETAFHVVDRGRLATPYANAAPEPTRVTDPYQIPFVPGLAPITFSLGRIFEPTSFPSGGGGMAGSGDEFARFLDAIRAGGGRMVSPASAQAMMSNQIGEKRIMFDPSQSTGFGFGGAVMLDPAKSGSPLSPGSWYWGGVWGHSWFVDPVRRMTIVNLTNTALEGMSGQLPRDVARAAVG